MPSRIKKYFETPKRSKNYEILDVWKKSILYFNRVYSAVKYFPKDVNYELDLKLKVSALSIPDNIARGSRSRNEEELETCLKDASESVYRTVSNLFIANKCNYVRKDIFHEIYNEGEVLTRSINRVVQE